MYINYQGDALSRFSHVRLSVYITISDHHSIQTERSQSRSFMKNFFICQNVFTNIGIITSEQIFQTGPLITVYLIIALV